MLFKCTCPDCLPLNWMGNHSSIPFPTQRLEILKVVSPTKSLAVTSSSMTLMKMSSPIYLTSKSKACYHLGVFPAPWRVRVRNFCMRDSTMQNGSILLSHSVSLVRRASITSIRRDPDVAPCAIEQNDSTKLNFIINKICDRRYEL